jgi:hypothetical protein
MRRTSAPETERLMLAREDVVTAWQAMRKLVIGILHRAASGQGKGQAGVGNGK